MAKECTLQMFVISLFVKGDYYVVNILHKYNELRKNNRLLMWNNFCYISQEKHCFCKIVWNIQHTCFITQFEYQGGETLGFIQVQTFEIYI